MNGIDDLPAQLWAELTRACHDRQHAWRTPVLATVDAMGAAQARTVVLRKAHRAAQQLIFYTDARSPKVQEIHAQPNVSALFWSSRTQWQLRINARAQVITRGELIDATWANIERSRAAKDYLSACAPGATLVSGRETVMQNSHHLAIILLDVQALDWLSLKREGHQRARVIRDVVTPLVP